MSNKNDFSARWNIEEVDEKLLDYLRNRIITILISQDIIDLSNNEAFITRYSLLAGEVSTSSSALNSLLDTKSFSAFYSSPFHKNFRARASVSTIARGVENILNAAIHSKTPQGTAFANSVFKSISAVFNEFGYRPFILEKVGRIYKTFPNFSDKLCRPQ